MRPSPFRGDMRRILEVRKRFPDPTTCAGVLWLTGAAKLQTVSTIDWNRKEFPKWDDEELVRDFNCSIADPPIIADVELSASLAGVISGPRWAVLMEMQELSRLRAQTSGMCFPGAGSVGFVFDAPVVSWSRFFLGVFGIM